MQPTVVAVGWQHHEQRILLSLFLREMEYFYEAGVITKWGLKKIIHFFFCLFFYNKNTRRKQVEKRERERMCL